MRDQQGMVAFVTESGSRILSNRGGMPCVSLGRKSQQKSLPTKRVAEQRWVRVSATGENGVGHHAYKRLALIPGRSAPATMSGHPCGLLVNAHRLFAANQTRLAEHAPPSLDHSCD